MHISDTFVCKSLYENRFWLEVLRDHAVFMVTTLEPRERELVQAATGYINLFTQRLDQICALQDSMPDQQTMIRVNNDNYQLALEFRNFQQAALDRLLVCRLGINMTPTFLEHMVREDEEYLRVLTLLQQGVTTLPPASEALHQHTLWLPDAAGHAAAIAGGLDMTEKLLIQKAEKFEKNFRDLFFKNYELKEMLYPYPRMLPVLERFNLDSAMEIKRFVCFLDNIKGLVERCEVLNELIPLMPDHMIREEDYYLGKLRETGTNI